VPLGGLKFGVRHAPGHTRGSVVFDLDDQLFSGDVLFAGSIGRVDLPGGSMADMTASLREVILPLPDETVVHPGHGPSTTIGRERATNPYLLDLL
jgi:glyoxylase-like metal-dependent hydrolase (beta-lactamase superfamily II)